MRKRNQVKTSRAETIREILEDLRRVVDKYDLLDEEDPNVVALRETNYGISVYIKLFVDPESPECFVQKSQSYTPAKNLTVNIDTQDYRDLNGETGHGD